MVSYRGADPAPPGRRPPAATGDQPAPVPNSMHFESFTKEGESDPRWKEPRPPRLWVTDPPNPVPEGPRAFLSGRPGGTSSYLALLLDLDWLFS